MTRGRTIRICVAFVSLILLAGLVEPVGARPDFLAKYQADPFRRAEVDGCSVCHLNPEGGGPRNPFGVAFDAAEREMTPMLRASFPDRFEVETKLLADGSVFYFSDPDDEVVVFKRGGDRVLLDLAALGTVEEEVIPPPANRMSFFVTSEGPGSGGHLKGLAGADRHCGELAEAAGTPDRTWHAYLSTSFGGAAAVNAGDRIGTGPWFNAAGLLVARGVADLHNGNRLGKEMALNEKGEMITGRGDDLNRHDILTGTLSDGTAAVGQNCNNWTSDAAGTALIGHHDLDGMGDTGSSWNSAHATRSCSQEDLRSTGGDGLFYCFAID